MAFYNIKNMLVQPQKVLQKIDSFQLQHFLDVSIFTVVVGSMATLFQPKATSQFMLQKWCTL